jgi:hypothetical protein
LIFSHYFRILSGFQGGIETIRKKSGFIGSAALIMMGTPTVRSDHYFPVSIFWVLLSAMFHKFDNVFPLVVSLSNHERSSFDQLRTNGNLFVTEFMESSTKPANPENGYWMALRNKVL